jgi:hypothetical protein
MYTDPLHYVEFSDLDLVSEKYKWVQYWSPQLRPKCHSELVDVVENPYEENI